MEIDFSKINITQIKEDINLLMFNSKHFTFEDMKLNNKIMEAIKDVKITINHDNDGTY